MSAAIITCVPDAIKKRIAKGAFATVSRRSAPQPEAGKLADALQSDGYRVLAVGFGPPEAMNIVGLIALSDPPLADSAALIRELDDLGVHTIMVTGDAPKTAAIVAKAAGLVGAVCPAGPLPKVLEPESYSVYAGVLPEDKYRLVQAFQKAGHVVGMCGDGANDAPALRQAQMGIAVSTATDVAKSAAGIVLTTSGLGGIVAAVKEGRITFQRIPTYTLNSIAKKIVVVLFLARFAHDASRRADADTHDYPYGSRRFSRHVFDHGQRRAVADAKSLEYRQTHDRRRYDGLVTLTLLLCDSRIWCIPASSLARIASNAGVRGGRIRESGFNLLDSGTSPALGLASKSVATCVIGR
jgi:soluble P-type ATPase